MSAELSAPLIGTDRHRLSTDGRGVTTLVAFHGCPLRCRYCLNPQCFDTSRTWRTVTPQHSGDHANSESDQPSRRFN